MAITVGLIDNRQSTTDGLISLLSNAPISIATSCAHSYHEGGQLIAQNQCDIYLIGTNLGSAACLDLINFIASKSKPSLTLLDVGDIPFIKKAMKVGSKGYLSNTAGAGTLITAISSVLEGKPFLDNIDQNSIHPTIESSYRSPVRA